MNISYVHNRMGALRFFPGWANGLPSVSLDNHVPPGVNFSWTRPREAILYSIVFEKMTGNTWDIFRCFKTSMVCRKCLNIWSLHRYSNQYWPFFLIYDMHSFTLPSQKEYDFDMKSYIFISANILFKSKVVRPRLSFGHTHTHIHTSVIARIL